MEKIKGKVDFDLEIRLGNFVRVSTVRCETTGKKFERSVHIPDSWDRLRRKWPLGRDYDSRATRVRLFTKFDINFNGLLGVTEVQTVVKRHLRIAGIDDFGPPVLMSFQAMQGVM